jgi:hypothetical protein
MTNNKTWEERVSEIKARLISTNDGAKYKPNDRVVVYGSSQVGEECWVRAKGVIINQCIGTDECWYNVKVDGIAGPATYHEKQLRRLKCKSCGR